MKKILFVCSGNTCRSPMAQGYFNSICDKSKYSSDSAGIGADESSAISNNAKEVLSQNNILLCRTSKKLTCALMEEFDYIFPVTQRHAEYIMHIYPQYANKVYIMGDDIYDPYGGDIDVYKQCFEQIKAQVNSLYGLLEKNDGQL